MIRKSVLALAGALSAFAFAAADAAVFSFDFSVQTYNGWWGDDGWHEAPNDIFNGAGELYATGNEADGYEVYGGTGLIAIPDCDFCATHSVDFAFGGTLKRGEGDVYFIDQLSLGFVDFTRNESASDYFMLLGLEVFAPHATLNLNYLSDETPDVGGEETSPTPEAATWAMMLVGFGAVGGALRGRRRVSVSFG